MTELQRYLAEEVAEDHADGIITRREAMRRIGLLGVTGRPRPPSWRHPPPVRRQPVPARCPGAGGARRAGHGTSSGLRFRARQSRSLARAGHASFAGTRPPPPYGRAGFRDLHLGNGRIMVSGPIVDRGRNDRTDAFAVVGGSGAYAAARGTTVSTEMGEGRGSCSPSPADRRESTEGGRQSGAPLPRAAELADSSETAQKSDGSSRRTQASRYKPI
jgi:hypothetical protein